MRKIFYEPDSDYFWNKKIIISCILSVLVFLAHISASANYDNSASGIVSDINNFFAFVISKSVAPLAVVLFFILSGFLFFRNFDISRYFHKLKSRMKSLLIPYLIWNTVWTLFAIITSYTFLADYFIGREKFEISVSNILNSVFLYSNNGVFWFIFDLIIFVIASPLIYYLLKNKYIGLLCIAASVVLLQFGIELPDIFYRGDSVIFFMIGGFYGIHGKKIFMSRTAFPLQILYGFVFIACIVINCLRMQKIIFLPSTLKTIFLFAFAISFWRFFDMIAVHIKSRPFFTRSFMIYAMHINVSAIITKILYLILPKSNIFCIPNTLLTIVLTLVLINFFCVLVNKSSPKLYNTISGGR